MSRTSSLDEQADPDAPIGSRPWAVAVLRNAKLLIHQLESDAKFAGNSLRLLKEHKAWKAFGYASFGLLCKKELGIEETEAAALVEAKAGETIAQVRERTTQERAKQAKPLAEHGGDRKSEGEKSTLQSNLDGQGNRASYLTRRIARDRPDVLERMKAGEFKSVRAAAKEAGIVKERTPLEKAKAAFLMLGDDERREFMAFIQQESS